MMCFWFWSEMVWTMIWFDFKYVVLVLSWFIKNWPWVFPWNQICIVSWQWTYSNYFKFRSYVVVICCDVFWTLKWNGMNHDLISASFTWFHPNLYCSQHGLFFCLAFGVLKTPSKLVSVPMACPCVVEMWPRARPGRHPLVYKMGFPNFSGIFSPLVVYKMGFPNFSGIFSPLVVYKMGFPHFLALRAGDGNFRADGQCKPQIARLWFIKLHMMSMHAIICYNPLQWSHLNWP